MSQRIRGQEATIQIVVDGDLKSGSFAKVSEFTLTPRQTISETPFLGESEDDLDFSHRGYDFSFSCHESDNKVTRLCLDLVAREAARLPHPAINIVVTFEYRSASEPAETLVLENCFLKLDSKAVGSATDYVVNSFSGKCKVMSEV